VLPNGTAYHATVDVANRAEYAFTDVGLLGEQVPLQVWNVSLSNTTCENCPFTWSGSSAIAFSRGNYTLEYSSSIKDNHIQGTFGEPYRVQVRLPEGFDVRNPLIGLISTGGTTIEEEDGSLSIVWNQTRFFECRFYDPGREMLLTGFGTIWVVIAIVLLVPYLRMNRRRGKGGA
jgi:hypothetical protein